MPNFCFVIAVYDEWNLASRLLKQLLANFPDEKVIVTTDGIHNESFKNYCKDNDVIYVWNKERLIEQKHGGKWLERLLKNFYECSNSDYLIKLDSDCWVNRGFKSLPNLSLDITGTLMKIGHPYFFIQGGCYAVKYSAVEGILDSKLLENINYKNNPQFTYKRFQAPYLYEGEIASNLILNADDGILSHVAHKLGLSIGTWSEINSQLRGKIKDPEKYAIIHPVKEI